MSKFCPMCNTYTNCTDNCKSCLDELENEKKERGNQMPKQLYPCDSEPSVCPFDAKYSEDCRYYCGLGVDEDEEENYESEADE